MFVYLQFAKEVRKHTNFDLFSRGASEMRESNSIRNFLLSYLSENITFKFEIISQAVSEHSFILGSVCETVVSFFFCFRITGNWATLRTYLCSLLYIHAWVQVYFLSNVGYQDL